MDLELEWYDNIRNGWNPLCDRCYNNISRNDFFENRNERGVYCEKCWNWIELKKWGCNICGSKGTIRSERLLIKTCCGKEVLWQK